MSELDNIIQITITRETAAVATASFNIPLLLATHTAFSERVRTYTGIDEVAVDFATTSKVYAMALRAFGQDFGRPAQILVGRRQVDSVEGTVPTVTTGAVYTVTINGTAYSYTAVGGNTAAQVVAGIKAQYDLAPKVGITFTDGLDGTFDVVVSVAGAAWSIKATSNITLVNAAPTESYVDAKIAVQEVNDTWYYLTADTHLEADQIALATAIQAEHKVYVTSSSDAELIVSTTGDVASALKAANNSRTSTVYLPTADTEYPEAAWVGGMAPQVVGSAAWNFKRAQSVTASNINQTARTNLRSKNCNMFTTVGGQNIFQDGVMADGRPMSEITISDWLYARMQEQVYFRIVNMPKLPFTRQGFAVIEGEIRSVLQQAQANGAIDTFSVSSPDPLAIPANQRAQGIAGNFTFTARLAGEVKTIIIRGTLTV
jgi:hypothetical protein